MKARHFSNGNSVGSGRNGQSAGSVRIELQPITLHELDPGQAIGIAVLGCGYWGANYVRIFNEFPNARVVVVCDVRRDRLSEIKRRFPGVETTTDVDNALAMAGVSAAVVCTEASSHYSIVSRCLAAGKHVLVEKPLTTTVADADELISQADAAGLTLMVGHTFLYNAGIRKVKEYVKQNEVGRIYYLYSSRTNLGPIRHDVNALWDLAPHDVSIFNFLLDSVPEWASAVGVRALRNEREDVGFISLGYPHNVVGHIHVSWADPNKVREVVVVGSNKRIAFDDLNPSEQVRIFEKSVTPSEGEPSSFGEYPFLMRDGDIVSPKIEVSEPLKNQSSHFLECVASGARPFSSALSGRDVVRVMEAIDRSIASNGAPVEVKPLENRRETQSRDLVAAPR